MYTTRSTLLQKIKDNDAVGFQEFYTAYRNLIRSTALKSNVPDADTDDIIQSVMMGIFNNGTFLYAKEKHGLFRTYLGGIIRHKICDYFRTASPGSVPLPEPENLPVEKIITSDFENIFLEEYRKHIFDLAIEQLKSAVSPEIFETFDLCIRHGLPDKKVARLLNEKPNTVTIRKKRCLEQLRNIILQLKSADPELDLPIL